MARDRDRRYVFQFGSVCFSCVVSLVTLRLCLETQEHTRLFQVVAFLSVIMWIPSAFIFDAGGADGMRGGMRRVFGSAAFWLTVLLVLVAATLRVYVVKMWNRHFRTECARVRIRAHVHFARGWAAPFDICKRAGGTCAGIGTRCRSTSCS